MHRVAHSQYRHCMGNGGTEHIKASLANADMIQKRKDVSAAEDTVETLYLIMDIIKFLEMQGLPSRGHDEDDASYNQGNFKEMIHLFRPYIPGVDRYILKGPANAQYFSPKVYAELLTELVKG